ncbi:MAG: Uma2 family endonuclease [Acidobacteriota bacterium]
MATQRAAILHRVDYPDSDGKPMGESDVHRDEMIGAIEALKDHFRDHAEVYVAGDLLLYYEEGDPAAVVVPDVMVVRGVAKRLRRSYKLWEEQHGPELVIEISSRSTRLEDLGTKRALYEMLGVQEYLLFDPLEEYLKPSFQGFILAGGRYVPLAPEADGSFLSGALGLRFRREGSHLRIIDAATGEPLSTPSEAMKRARAEAEARAHADERAARAEAELERLRALLGGSAAKDEQKR